MGSGGWGAVAAAMMCSGSCAQSHPPAAQVPAADLLVEDAAKEEDAASAASSEEPVSLLTRCGVPDPEQPALIGTDGSEVWIGWLDGRQERVRPFGADDPAVSPGLEPRLRLADTHLLVSVGGELTQQGPRALSHALLSLDGAVLWTRSWAAGEGGEVEAFGADGSVVLPSEGHHVWLRPDGSEQSLVAGFTPLATPDAEGWMPGIFSQAGDSMLHGFQRIATDERRFAGAMRSDLREFGTPELVDGRFYYTFVDTSGVASLGVEGPDSQTTLVLDGVSELPHLTRGPTHTLVHVGTRPVALLERATLKLTPLDAVAETSPDEVEDRRQRYLQADGDWFVLTARSVTASFDAEHPYHATPIERLYRIHAPTGRLDVEPAAPVPAGLARSSYATCGWGDSGQSIHGQLVQGLAPLDAAPPLVQMYLEDPDADQGWTALGNPIAFAMGPGAVQVGESWLLRSGDVRHSYCNHPWIEDPSALGPEVLVGRSVQVVAPDGEILAFDGEDETFGEREDEISLSADGSCALIYSDGRTWIHDLLTHAEHDVELPNARWLHEVAEPH